MNGLGNKKIRIEAVDVGSKFFFSVKVDRFPGIESKLFNRRGNVRFPRVGMLMNDDEHNQTNRREACRDSE